MDPVIIMVGRVGEGVHDIEVMPDIPADELADAIAISFGWKGTYDIQINGKRIDTRQTLAEVNAWDGSEIRLVETNRPPRVKTPIRFVDGYRVLKTSSQAEKGGSQSQSEVDNKLNSNTKKTEDQKKVMPAMDKNNNQPTAKRPITPESKVTRLSSSKNSAAKTQPLPSPSEKSNTQS